MEKGGSSVKRKHFLVGIGVLLLCAAYPHLSWGQANRSQLLSHLQKGGHVLYFRHGEKDGDSGISSRLPAQFSDCLNPDILLTEAGVSAMQSLGQQFAQLNIPVGQVISSPVCRCLESAWLSFGQATIDSSLNGVYEKDNEGNFIINEAVTEELAINLRRLLVKTPEEGSNTLLFAHSSNILALTGLQLQQGEAALFKPDGQGNFIYVGRVTLNEWERLE